MEWYLRMCESTTDSNTMYVVATNLWTLISEAELRIAEQRHAGSDLR